MAKIIEEIHKKDILAILLLWLKDMWKTKFGNIFKISVHCVNLYMTF